MLIHKYLWLGLGFFVMNGIENCTPCFASEQEGEISRSIPSFVSVLLSSYNMNLGNSQDLTDKISDPYSKAQAQFLIKKDDRTADEESDLASIYASSSNHAKTVGMQQELLLEALRHYLKAADQGRVDTLMTIALFLEALESIGTKRFLKRIDPGEKIEDAVIDLFKLAAQAGITDAQEAYEDRSSARSSPERSMDSHGSGR